MLPVLVHRTLNNANNVIHHVAAQDLNPDTMGDRQVLQDCYMKLWYFTKLYTLGSTGIPTQEQCDTGALKTIPYKKL